MYESLRSRYTESLNKLYDRDIKNLFDNARDKISGMFYSIAFFNLSLFKQFQEL